jgi:hypothetical protein
MKKTGHEKSRDTVPLMYFRKRDKTHMRNDKEATKLEIIYQFLWNNETML